MQSNRIVAAKAIIARSSLAMATYRAIVSLVLLLVITSACEPRKKTVSTDSLIGTWKSGTKESEWGKVVSELTFTETRFRMVHRFLEGTKPLILEGTYNADGGKIKSSLFKNGQAVDFWFQDKHLVLREDSGPVLYTRQR